MDPGLGTGDQILHEIVSQCGSPRNSMLNRLCKWYLTPKLVALMFMGSEDKCWRCGKSQADFMHIWWERDIIRISWESVQ